MTGSARARAVVFDFGGVLITTIGNQIAKVAESHDVESTVMHEILLGPRASTPDHPWHRAERGEIPLAEIQPGLKPWAQEAGLELHGDEIERLLAVGEYTVIDAMVERVASLHADRVPTGLLTNTFAEFRTTMERDLDLTMFDAVVESFAVGARKPEPAIYDLTAERLGVEHTDIVYLDDFDQNLKVPRSLGWTTVHVVDPMDAIGELDRVLAAG